MLTIILLVLVSLAIILKWILFFKPTKWLGVAELVANTSAKGFGAFLLLATISDLQLVGSYLGKVIMFLMQMGVQL